MYNIYRLHLHVCKYIFEDLNTEAPELKTYKVLYIYNKTNAHT